MKLRSAFLPCVLSVASVLGGCSTSSQYQKTENTTVSNRTENSGPKQYGSQACRDARVTPVEGGFFEGRRGQMEYPTFSRYYFASKPEVREKVSVTSKNGNPYILASEESGSQIFSVLGAAGGAAIAGTSGKGLRNGGRNAVVIIGAAVAGSLIDDMRRTNFREAFDRCRLDVIEGAYDAPKDNNIPLQRVPR